MAKTCQCYQCYLTKWISIKLTSSPNHCWNGPIVCYYTKQGDLLLSCSILKTTGSLQSSTFIRTLLLSCKGLKTKGILVSSTTVQKKQKRNNLVIYYLVLFKY